MVKSIPEGLSSVNAYIILDNPSEAISFYKKALDAKEVYSLKTPDGMVVHAEIAIGNTRLMVGAASERMETSSAKTLGGTPVSFVYYTDNIDAVFEKARKAGMKEKMPVTEQFWGDRMGALIDPYGMKWSIAQHVRDVSEEEMQNAMRRMEESCSKEKSSAA